jgi:hypothetical protein
MEFPCATGIAGTGPVLINLRFSEPMDTTAQGSGGIFDVQLQFADGTTQDVTSGGQWRTNALPNDSWTVTTTLPSPAPVGKVVVSVRARKVICSPELDVNSQELDTTGSGNSAPPSYDVSETFSVGNPVVIGLLQDDVTPVPNGGTATSPNMSIVATSLNGATVDSIFLLDGYGNDADGSPYFPLYELASATATFSGLPPGNYTAYASDSNDNESKPISFTIPTSPLVTLFDLGGQFSIDLSTTITVPTDDNVPMYLSFSGNNTSPPFPSAIMPIYVGGLQINVQDTVAPIQTITVNETIAYDDKPILQYTQSPNAGTFSGQIPAPLGAGHYVLTVIDAVGLTTIAPFDLDNITMSPGSTGNCDSDHNLSGSFTVSANAGVSYYETINNDGTSDGPISVCDNKGTTPVCPPTYTVPFEFVNGVSGAMNIGDGAGNEIGVFPSGCNPSSPTTPLMAGPYLNTIFPVGLQDEPVPIGLGVTAYGVNAAGPTALDLSVVTPFVGQLPLGYISASPGGIAYGLNEFGGGQGLIDGPNAGITPPFTLTFPPANTLTPGQLANLSVSVNDTGNPSLLDFPVPDASGGLATYTVGNVGGYEGITILAPQMPNPAFLVAGDPSRLMYDLSNPNVTMTAVASTQPALVPVLAQAAAQGFASISPIVQLGPANSSLTYPAFLSMTATRSGGSIYQFSPGQSPQKLPTQYSYAGNTMTAALTSFNSYYGIFSPLSDFGGSGIALDATNLLWSISLNGPTTVLAHNDVNGVMTSSAVLPGADVAFPWSLFFDPTGDAYSIGDSVAPNGADLLTVYKAAPTNAQIISSQTFDSGYNNNNFVYDAVSPGWIVGSVQTQGPIDQSQPAQQNYSAALWQFNPAQGLVQLTTSYSRAGNDEATGLAIDGSGNLWVAGFSLSPNPLSSKVYDLALWKYAADGHTLLGGPYVREGWLSSLNTSLLARVFVSSSTVYVAAPRSRGAGGTDMALVSFDATTGRVLSENAWRPSDGSTVYPSTLLQDVSGNLLAAGSFDYGSGTIAGLWRYGLNGALLSVSQTDAGGVEGAVLKGSSLWLSVDGSTSPYLDTAETPASGGPSDILPPRTSLSTGTPSFGVNPVYVSSATPLGFSVIDDAFVRGDGLGVGSTQTFYVVDQATASLTASSFSLFTTSFTLAAEGIHTVSFYSVDLEGNAGFVRTSSAAVDLTAPIATVVSSGTLFAITAYDPVSNGVASGVAQITFLIDADNCSGHPQPNPAAPVGTCANDIYSGPFALSEGTHTVIPSAADAAAPIFPKKDKNYTLFTSFTLFGDELGLA